VITASDSFRLAVENSRSDYLISFVVSSYSTSSVLRFTEADIWMGGVEISDSFAEAGTLGIGGCVINQAKVTLMANNTQGSFTPSSFYNCWAQILIGYSGVDNGTDEWISKFNGDIVSVAVDGPLITLTLYDYMYRLDKPIASTFAAWVPGKTIRQIVAQALLECRANGLNPNVPVPNGSSTIGNTVTLNTEATSYRDIICWVAQIAGGYARYNSEGLLEIKAFPLSLSTQINIDQTITVDSFSDPSFYVRGSGANFFTLTDTFPVVHSTFSHEVAGKSLRVRKVTFGVKDTDSSANDTYIYYSSNELTNDGIEIIMKDNDLIKGFADTDIVNIANDIVTTFAGQRYYLGNLRHVANPLMEAGDAFAFMAKDGNYVMIASNIVWSIGSAQTTESNGVILEQADATQYTPLDKDYATTKSMLSQIATTDTWTETNASYGITVTAKKRNGVVMLYLASSGISIDMSTHNAYITVSVLPEGYRPAMNTIRYEILNGTMKGQLLLNSNGNVRIGYTRALTATANADLTANMLLYANAVFLTE
jgi:hypothetical protein